MYIDKIQSVKMANQTLEAEKMQNAQFLREINFKLDLLPALSEKVNAIPGLSDSIAALQVQMNNISTQLSRNVETNEEIKKELENVKSDLVIISERANQLETEQKRTNLIIYNYTPQHHGEYTVKQEIMDLLNRAMPSLKISRCDVRDIFRLKSGPVVVKLNSVEIRDYILRNSSLLRKGGLSVAPDYTAKQREARKHLKEIMNLAQNDGRDAMLRGDKLFIQGRLFRYDGKAVIKVKCNLAPVKNIGPPPSARLPNYPAVIPMGLDSDASNSDAETVIPSTAYSQAVSATKRPASAVISPNDLHQPGTRNLAPRGNHSPRKGLNRRPRSGFSRNFVDNSQRVLTDINSRSREYYHFAFSSTEARNEDLQEMASDINALTESIDA